MYIHCSSCTFGVVVEDTDECFTLFSAKRNPERDNIYRCPQCRGILQWETPEASMASTMSVLQAHIALSNLGMPGETECSASRVREVLQSGKILSVDVVNIPGTTRSLLRSITMEDGTQVFLEAGGHGVTVYRIRKGRSVK